METTGVNIEKPVLAVVIPAYKHVFFRETLESIANQTCKLFTLYIGDDNSPYRLDEVIREYEQRINIVYKRYEHNLGNHDLAAHWNRCVDMVVNEEWVWLFSDDDIMDSNCVELFYRHITNYPDDELIHFNVEVIDDSGNRLEVGKPFPEKMSAGDFFFGRIASDYLSFAVEYVVKRRTYEKEGKFQSFDLAWCSDDASWIKFSNNGGIKTIDGAKVRWRHSHHNICSMKDDPEIIARKVSAAVKYIDWVTGYFQERGIKDDTTKLKKVIWVIQILVNATDVPLGYKMKLIQSLDNVGFANMKVISTAYLFYRYVRKRFTERDQH